MLNPPYVDDFCRSARWAAKSRGRVQRHPDWMAVATAVLEEDGHDAKLLDAQVLNMEKKEVEQQYSKFNPDMVVIHTTTPSIYNDIEYAGLVKETVGDDVKTVLIGAHASAVPDDTFNIARDKVDAIVRGEYDYTLRDIARDLDFNNILGLSYRTKKGKIVHNEDRPFIKNVDDLPFPAWQHIKPEWYHDGGKLYPFITLISGRGCFGTCTFCRETQVTFGRALRMRSPRKVVDEMEYDLKLFPQLKEIMIETDTFTALPKHTKGVCEEIMERGLDITWSANARVDTVDYETLKLMKKAGCRMLLVGFESGTQNGLNALKKGTTLDHARKFAENAKKAGICVFGAFMIGVPGETRESAIKTIEFAKSLPITQAQFSGMCPYPGTQYYDYIKENKYLTVSDWTEWVTKDYEQATLVSYPQLSKEEIDELVDKGLKEFYLRPDKILQIALSIRNFGDLKTKIFGFKSFVDYFKSKKKGC